MMKANTASVDKKRKYAPRGRAVKRLPLRLRLKTEMSFFVDIVDDETAALFARLQQKECEAALQYEREHNSQWWD